MLEHRTIKILDRWPVNELMDLLNVVGVEVRYYDPEEKQWMGYSERYGLTRTPGARDGTWSFPTLQEFERDYLVDATEENRRS
jgi:hypothetical protein